MAFKLTYSDGQESQHDDDTVWELDDGVLKLGREKGKWSVLLSPSHWAVLEIGGTKSGGGEEDSDKKSDEKSDTKDKSEDSDGSDDKKDAKDKSDKDDKDDKDDD
jgi:hypothetical protein